MGIRELNQIVLEHASKIESLEQQLSQRDTLLAECRKFIQKCYDDEDTAIETIALLTKIDKVHK